MTRGSKHFGLACGLLLIVACERNAATVSPDSCIGGSCNEVEECGMGICDFDQLSSTITSHSPSAGTFTEGEMATCPYTEDEVPPLNVLLDDSKIPEFNRARGRDTNYYANRGYLQDHELHEHLLGVQGALFECLDMAACYDDEPLAAGELDFKFELEPNGRVTAVSVKPSKDLDTQVVTACARRSVYDLQFPAWNGARMVVSYTVEISESV